MGVDSAFYYFVHSFRAVGYDPKTIVASTEYGGYMIPSIVKKGNIVGCQFHPERSGQSGLHLLKNILDL